ncbi:MAG TPA: LPS assembly protein LptD [Candidatus Limnocylindrales bacterium]|nr:LPS assembly protein LptD [Candidatus Limnocylindrales bacterium]
MAALLLLAMALPLAPLARGQTQPRTQTRLQTRGGVMTLEADTQKQVGKVFYADGRVDILYQGVRLRADHVQYNEATKIVAARGHVQFDYQTQHMDADDATYNIATDRGSFRNVRGTVRAQHLPNPNVLVSPNPLSFAAATVERTGPNTFVVTHAWVTVCRPARPQWKFYAPRAVIRLQKSVTLDDASFRLFYVPIIYLPRASVPIGRKLRQSGFLIPDATTSTTKGYVFGDSFYWAPTEWMDATIGAQYLSKRGSSENAELRMKPWRNVTLNATYYGVIDRGIPGPGGTLMKQGGHEDRIFFDAMLPGGWRAVADLDQLSSLTFRLAFAQTFAQAVNSEVRNTAFLTKNTDGFSVSLASMSYKNFLSAQPDTAIDIRTAPEVHVSSVDRAPWKRWPFYFGFDAFADAMHRETNVPPQFSTPSFVSRMEFAPNVTLPLHWGSWLGVTPSFTLLSMRYGGQLQNGVFVDQPLTRTAEEFSLDVRPPAFDRVWSDGATKWKHVIEPKVEYHYVSGVNDFARFLRFDENDTLTDTNDVQYGVTQRLFRRAGDGNGQELLSWDLKQKYYFDPTFGGALIPGARNVFQALDSLTPFAFADSLHHFSPVISDLRIEPGGRFDTEFRADFDPERGQLTAIGTLLKIRPYKESFITLAHFSAINIPAISPSNPGVYEPYSNQLRALVGYGNSTGKGWSTEFGLSYDISQALFQNQMAQISYNGSCCGIGFEYRRLALGPVRNENEFGLVFRIANIASVGNLRKQESIF